jgi:excisionase family DNA binding protein
MTVAEAAELLEITKEAVRKRISRGSLRSDKDPDGTVWVYVPVSPTASGTASGSFDRDELVAELRARIEDLRTDRDAWRDQARRSDYLASTAMDRTRELEGRLRELEAGPEPAGSSEPRESSESTSPTDTPTEATGEAVAGAQEPDRAPWWRRIFGG